MPHFADGLMLLGVTLSEQRKEDDAISVYDEAISEYEPTGKKLQAQQAQLFKAIALRKHYNWQNTHRSLSTIRSLEVELHKLMSQSQDRADFDKILLSAQTSSTCRISSLF